MPPYHDGKLGTSKLISSHSADYGLAMIIINQGGLAPLLDPPANGQTRGALPPWTPRSGLRPR